MINLYIYIYVGMSILDLSKLHTYSFYYNVLKKKYEDKLRLIYTDIDRFLTYIEIEDEDVYDDFKESNKYMEFSGYDKEQNMMRLRIRRC